MIVTIFVIFNYGLSIWKGIFSIKCFHISRKRNKSEVISPFRFELPLLNAKSIIDPDYGLRFYPRVFTQRYEIVREILNVKKNYGGINKVIDLGCSEIDFFRYIKNLGVNEYVAVDIDGATLKEFCNKVTPLAADYLMKRTEPLKVQVLEGSASEPDINLKGANVVIAIELIEHLFPDTLEALPYNIFGILQPEVVVFTTPNSDFNILFTDLKGFRHSDHKFEWSREQFEDWGNNLVVRYPDYEVAFCGVGSGPKGTEGLGSCSQLAIFFRKSREIKQSSEFQEKYRVIKYVDYPYQTAKDKLEDMIRNAAESIIWKASDEQEYLKEQHIEVPLSHINRYIKEDWNCTEEILSVILLKAGWNIELIDGRNTVIVTQYAIQRVSSSYSSNESERSLDIQGAVLEHLELEENWDIESCLTDENMQSNENDHNGLNETTNEHSTISTSTNSDPGDNKNVKMDEGSKEVINIKLSPVAVGPSSHYGLATQGNHTKSDIKVVTDLTAKISKRINPEGNSNESDSHNEIKPFPLQKCQSLEQVCPDKSKIKNFRFSLNMEKNVFDCDNKGANNVRGNSENLASNPSFSETFGLRLEDSCSQSKAGDSGYPNSCSHEMDMDLTPEQVDEIITESESSFEGEGDEESLSGDDQHLADFGIGVVHFLDNVENGDVANNNRDGEGNNMEDNRPVGDPLEFQQRVIEDGEAQGNMAGAEGDRDSEEENFFISVRQIPHSSSINDSFPHPTISIDMASTQAIVGSASSSANDSFFGLYPLGHVQEQVNQFVRIDEYRFPEWLLNMLPEEDGMGGGDAVSDIEINDNLDNLVDDRDIDDDYDENDDNIDDDDLDDDGLGSEQSIEMIVQGDVLGGGDPSTR